MLEEEQSYLDIDWFFTNNKNIEPVTSAGGELPRSVCKSKVNLQLLTSYFEELPYPCRRVPEGSMEGCGRYWECWIFR